MSKKSPAAAGCLLLLGAACVGDPAGGDHATDGGPGTDGDVPTDLDGDGWSTPEDCDDNDAETNPAVVEDEEWGVETIVPDRDEYAFVGGVQVDHGGVQVVYTDFPPAAPGLRRARRVAGVWSEEAVDVDPTAGIPGGSALGSSGDSFVLSPDGVAHVVYLVGPDPRTVRYATDVGGDFATEDIAEGDDPAIAVGPEGEVHVAFKLYDPPLLMHAVREDGAWTVEQAADASPGTALGGPAISVTPDGYVHIVDTWQADSPDGCGSAIRPRHVSNEGGEWTVETFDDPIQAWVTSLQVALDGSLHLALYEGRNEPLSECPIPREGIAYYLTRDLGSWSVELEIVDPVGAQDPEARLLFALDPTGSPQALKDGAGMAATYTTPDGSGTWLEDASVDAIAGHHPMIAAGEGEVHLATDFAGELEYAHRTYADGADNDCDGVAW